ncbi:MAG: metallophosphoesterase [Bradymonadia bacterium]
MPAIHDVWGRKVVRLPDRGVLLYATDLQGNRRDYERMKAIYDAEVYLGNDPILVFCGDMVHGPSPDLNAPGAWPEHLGTPYVDESAALICDYEVWRRTHRTFSLLGNHEHAHIGGPVVPKFYPDEAAVLDEALGAERARLHAFFRDFPLIAVAPNGLVLTHGAPYMAPPSLSAYERMDYAGYKHVSINEMYRHDPLASILWARGASEAQAQRFLDKVGGTLVAHGHDVVHEGYETTGDEQICLSTSYGLRDADKVYLRVDLSEPCPHATELWREGCIRYLYSINDPSLPLTRPRQVEAGALISGYEDGFYTRGEVLGHLPQILFSCTEADLIDLWHSLPELWAEELRTIWRDFDASKMPSSEPSWGLTGCKGNPHRGHREMCRTKTLLQKHGLLFAEQPR